MPLFNPMFAYLFFHAFQRLNNMYAYLGIRDGQSYNGILERKLPLPDVLDMLSDEFVITERTIALFHLYVACSLDSGITLKREKAGVYAAHVQTLTKMNGKKTALAIGEQSLLSCSQSGILSSRAS